MKSKQIIEKILQYVNDKPKYVTDDPRKAYAIGILDTMFSDGSVSEDIYKELWSFIVNYNFDH